MRFYKTAQLLRRCNVHVTDSLAAKRKFSRDCFRVAFAVNQEHLGLSRCLISKDSLPVWEEVA